MTKYSSIVFSILFLGAYGCERCGCGGDDPLAELVESEGKVERDWADKLNKWKPAKLKAAFFIGDGIRAQKKSQAVLKLSEGSYARLKAESMIRFVQSMEDSNQAKIDLQKGEAEIEVGSNDLDFNSSIGLAKLSAHSRIRIRKSDKGLDFLVKIGNAVFHTQGEKKTVLKAGEGIQIGIGTAVLTRYKEEERVEEKKEVEPEPVTEPESTDTDLIDIIVKGDGVRAQSPDEKDWQTLSPGINQVKPKALLDLPTETSVQLQRGDDKAMLHGKGKFQIGTSDSPLVQTWSGRVDLDSSSKDLAVIVPGGVIIADGSTEGNSRASIDINKDSTSVKALTGLVTVKQKDEEQTLEAGEQTTIDRPKRKPKAIQHQGFVDTGPDYADFVAKAGTSFVVHYPKPPIAAELSFAGKCPVGGVASIIGKKMRSQGDDSARLLLSGGRNRYKVQCLDEQGKIKMKPVATGRITVVRDSGTARLPRKAPLSTVDADGRVYTILYQNQLPAVNFRWRKPPKASSYILHINSPNKKRKALKLRKPEYTIKSGKLREGTHKLHFQASGSSKASKPTSVNVRFDNVAPKVSLASPKDRSFHAGQTVLIKGVAVPGWKISLNNGTIELDQYHRFSGNAHYSGDYRSIALRVTHPRRGTHYYLRRGQK